MIRRLAVSIFKFFASLKLAIFLLLALALVFATGTLVESAYSTEAAKLLVYRNPWMSLLLILLALNVAAAALDRLPWKQKHVGFVVTHAGIILILTGALITRAYGIEGQMAIAEGETQSRIILNEPLLQIFSEDSTPLGIYRIPLRAFPWQGRETLEPLGTGTDSMPPVYLLQYFPKASRAQKVEASSEGPAALHVTLESSWMKQSHWLVLDDPHRSELLLGPAVLRFTRESITVNPKTKNEIGSLEFQFENSTVKIPLSGKAPQKFRLKGTPYEATVLRILKNAVVEGNKLLDPPGEWKNPACEILLEGNGIHERHTIFSNFPDFPTMHGMKPSAAGVKIFFRRPESESAGPRNELRFVWQESGLPLYQVRKGEEISQGPVELHRGYSTGWMDFKFRVEEFYPHATMDATYKEEPLTSESEEHLSAAQIEVGGDGSAQKFWLGQGDRENIRLGKKTFQMVYGLRTLPVGFRLELRDFRVEHYPGTGQPASFESDVTLKDDFNGIERNLTIRMNHPLTYRGFKVFQSGYQQNPGEPEISIFTVARDPGIPVKYGGALVLIGGILTMFYTRRFSNREGRAETSLRGSAATEAISHGIASPRKKKHSGLAMTIAFLALTFLTGFVPTKSESAESLFRSIPVQSGGRVKPFESFAREALISVTGKRSLEGKSATTVVWNWMAEPEKWHTKSFLPVRAAFLKQEFSLMVIGGNVSPEVVLSHGPFQDKVQEALARQEKKEKLGFQEKKRIELYDQARLFQAIAQGAMPGFFPHPENPKAGWISLAGLADPEERAILERDYSPANLARVQASLARLVGALREEKETSASSAAKEFKTTLEEFLASRDIVLDRGKIATELFYNATRPFQWAWIFYLASGLLWFLLREKRALLPIGFFSSGFLYHTLGFVLRCYLAGRPPVSNMYESIIWVAWAAALFSGILGLIHRKFFFPAAAAWVASFMLLIGESFPAVLDPSLAPLVPVLRNNYWLTIHVLTITLSYGAFALAWGMAHANLASFAFRPKKIEEREILAEYVYRALQIGVVLLAAGTILGGVWANDSWGRFWGWDPKETWALIALLGYLAVLHARFAKWIGPFGTCLGAAIGFLGIVMAWYGVNFVLAAGLHSYGFGGGGLPYVAAVVGIDLAFISFLTFRYNKQKFRPALSQNR